MEGEQEDKKGQVEVVEGKATQGGALMDDCGDVYDKTQILAMRCETTSKSARYVRAQCIMCTTQASV